MPSFSDSIFLFVLALLLFGPKKLPSLARELGKWVGEFRRASNEFKMQMEEELRQAEQDDRQKQIAAMEAAAPVAAAPVEEPAHPHLPAVTDDGAATETAKTAEADATAEMGLETSRDTIPEPLPIATSGELKMMPPATGLPTARTSERTADPLGGGLLESIPSESAPPAMQEQTVMAGEGESGGR